MNRTKLILITGFALFSMFFGAGNLILPPFLGFQSGNEWFLVAIGFCLSAVALPLLGILAHSKLQGSVMSFTQKIHPVFGLIYGVLLYGACILLPCPRTASVTYELSVAPFVEMPSFVFSTIYFGLALMLVLNRNKILDVLGEYLTPAIIIIMVLIIGISIFAPHPEMSETILKRPFADGLLEGYQTFDAIASIIVGGVIVTSLNANKSLGYGEKRKTIIFSGIGSGVALFLIYAGLIYAGSAYGKDFSQDASRTGILSLLSHFTLGKFGAYMLSILVGLACFSTAVGLIVGTADFFKTIAGNSQKVYVITAVIATLLGIVIGQMNVQYIINVAVPVLVLTYPLTLVLIILNNLPNKWLTPYIFGGTVLITILFSIPDFLASMNIQSGKEITEYLPLGGYSLGWIIPTVVTWGLLSFLTYFGVLARK